MKFAQFEELDPIYFQTLRETMGDEAELGDDSQADDEEVQDLLAEDTQESKDQLDDNSDFQDNDTEEEESDDDYEDADNDDVPTEQQQPPIFPDPFPVAQADTNFIQTFIANIFIFRSHQNHTMSFNINSAIQSRTAILISSSNYSTWACQVHNLLTMATW